MKKLYSLTLKAFIGPFVATFFIALFVLLMQFLWKYIDYLAGKGLSYSVIGELLVYASANLIPMAIPISILLSGLMTFGNLAENYELLAFKSAGVSLARIMVPLAFVVFLISVAAFLFANYAIPKANLKFKSLLWDIREQKPAMDIIPGVFYSGLDGYSIRISKKDLETDVLYGITIYDHSEGRGNVQVTKAESGTMKVTSDKQYMILDLKNGSRYYEMPEEEGKENHSYPHTSLNFEEYVIRFDLSSFAFRRSKDDGWKNHAQMLNIEQLSDYIDSSRMDVKQRIKYIRKYVKPYISQIGDSLFVRKSLTEEEKAKLEPEFLLNIPAIDRKPTIQRALANARSVKSTFRSASSDIGYQLDTQIRARIELHRKYTLSLACLFLFFIGAPLGAIIKKGGLGLPVVVSTIMFVVFYIITISGEKSAKQYIVDAAVGMWYPVLFLIPIGAYLTYKANTDSKLFDVRSRFSGLIHRYFRNRKKAKSVED